MNATSNPADGAPKTAPVDGPALPPSAAKSLSVRIVGIGGAGGNAVAHLAQGDLVDLKPLVIHTSARILDALSAPEKVLLGMELTHGLGAGGDPSLGRAAAERDIELLRSLCRDLDLLFVVTGLGGGTGTGVAPVLARVAKESGALVLGVATLPFDIEGARRRRQAEQGLEELKAAADGVICLANQKMFGVVDENTTVLETFKITNDLLAQGIRGIWQMLTRPGLIHVDFSDLCAVLRDRHAASTFATVEARGEGRAREIVEQLLASPFLDGGQALAEAEAVLVNLVGGPDLAMSDVRRIMEEINRRTDNAQLIMGASVTEHMQGRIGLNLVASRRGSARESQPPSRIVPPAPAPILLPDPELENDFLTSMPHELASARFAAPPPEFTPEKAEEVKTRERKHPTRPGRSSFRLRQGDLPLEIVSKGRFEKTQPTIHRGEDLDVPTYVRRGIPLN
jgi:cell division protein FtsZ